MSYPQIDWSIDTSRTGPPYLKFSERNVCSPYNPIREAETLSKQMIERLEKTQSTYIVLIGYGIGYLADALSQRKVKNVIIFEPFQELFANVSPVPSPYPIVHEISSFERELNKLINSGSKPLLETHPGYSPYVQFEDRYVRQLLSEIYLKKTQNSDYILSERSLDSLSSLPFLKPINPLKEQFKEQPALLISPGPSLKGMIDLIRFSSYIKFCSIQALPYLQKNKIHVHFVVVSDPNDLSAFLEDSEKTFDFVLIEGGCHPKTLNWCPEKTWIYQYPSDQLYHYWWKKIEGYTIPYPLATVSETMLVLANYLGFNQYYLCGMDFSWNSSDERYSYRSPGSFASHLDSSEVRFKIHLSQERAVETETNYFHAARFIEFFGKKLKEPIFRNSELLHIPNTTSFDQRNLERSHHETVLSALLSSNLPFSFKEQIDQARNLIEELNHFKGQRGQAPPPQPDKTSLPYEKQMPFLHPLPEEIREQKVKELDRSFFERMQK